MVDGPLGRSSSTEKNLPPEHRCPIPRRTPPHTAHTTPEHLSCKHTPCLPTLCFRSNTTQRVVGGWLAAVGGWGLWVDGGWQLVAAGGWALVAVGGCRLMVPWGGPHQRKKTSPLNTGAPSQDAPPPHTAHTTPEHLSCKHTPCLPVFQVANTTQRVVGGWLAAVGGWGLWVDGGWQLVAAGGWALVAVGGCRLMVPWGGPHQRKKTSPLNTGAPSQDAPPPHTAHTTPEHLSCKHTPCLPVFQVANTTQRVVGGWLAAVGGWGLWVDGGWQLVAAGGWALVAVGGCRLMVPWGGPHQRKKTSPLNTGAPSQDAPPPHTAHTTPEHLSCKHTPCLPVFQVANTTQRVVGGWLAAVGGWGLWVDGGWQLVAAGGWALVAVGGCRLMVPWGGPHQRKKTSPLNTGAPSQDAPPPHTAHTTPEHLSCKHTPCLPVFQVANTTQRVVGGWLAAVGGWGLWVDGGWQLVAAGGWALVAVGGCRLMVPWGGPHQRKKTSPLNTGAPSQDAPPPHTAHTTPEHLSCKHTPCLPTLCFRSPIQPKGFLGGCCSFLEACWQVQ